MDTIQKYIKQRQFDIDEQVQNLEKMNLSVFIKSSSIKIDQSFDDLIQLLKEKYINIIHNNNFIEIKTEKYYIQIYFILNIYNNRINCDVEINIKDYHDLCNRSNSQNYTHVKYNLFSLTNSKLFSEIDYLIHNINNNHKFCECKL
jgi:hypothetical protein